MRLMSKQSTNQWIHNKKTTTTYVTNIFLACLLTTEVLACAAAAAKAKQQPCFARQLDNNADGTCDDSFVSNFYHQPHFTGNRSVIVQLFEWKFLDIAEECRLFLGPKGYAGVQLSPALEHTVIKTDTLNHPWWERYEVISYRLASRSGDETEFWAMSRICNDNGVRIYADVVLNHMAAPLHLLADHPAMSNNNKDFIVDTLLEENVNISQLNYPNVSYTQEDFHSPCNIGNTQNAHEIRNCQLNGHPDLDHSHAAVQEHIVEMLNKFIDMGVAGFRIDTAKHIWPIDLKKLFEQVDDLSEDFNFEKNTRPFVYQDVFDLGLDSVSKTEYSTYGVVSEYLYPAELATILNGKAPLSSLINWGPAMGFLAHQDSLIFIDSPDTQRGLPIELGHNYMLTHKQRIKYIMANAFMLAHPYGNIKRIMSSYYFPAEDINQGPPVEEEDENAIRSPQFNEQHQCTKESGWVCEHRWPPLVNMMKVANYFSVPGQQEKSLIHFQTNGPNQIAFCRGYKLFMAMNNDPELEFAKEVYTCMEPGIYCDMITGGKKEDGGSCNGKQLEVNEQGYAQLVLAVADVVGDGGNDDDVDGDDVDVEDEQEESQKVESYGVLVVYVGSKLGEKTEEEIDVEVEEGNENVDIDPVEAEENAGVEDNEVNEGDNANETPENTAMAENEEPPEEGEEIIDQPEVENEAGDETDAENNVEEEPVIEEAPEEGETPEDEDNEAENQVDENNEETGEEPPADDKPQEDDAEKPLENELEENPGEPDEPNSNEASADAAESAIENTEQADVPPEEETAPEESSKEIDSQEETGDVPENIDEIDQTPEEQLEKPSASIVDDINKKPEPIQDIQKAGFFSNGPSNK